MYANEHGLTPAMAAALGGHAKTVSFLVRFTTDDEVLWREGLECTGDPHEHIRAYESELCACLRTHTYPDTHTCQGNSLTLKARNHDGENIFLYAARAGSCAVLEQLAQEQGIAQGPL